MTVAAPELAAAPANPGTPYETGVYAWALGQAHRVRAGLDHLEDSPSLFLQVAELIARAYPRPLIVASGEMDLDESTLLESCPYSYDEIMTRPAPWPPAP